MMKKEISLSEKEAAPAGRAPEKDGAVCGQRGAEQKKESVSVEACPQKTLFAALADQGVVLEAGCNGKGRCGRCRVRYLTAAPLPAATERRFFSAQELRGGMRLACLHPVSRACRVETAYLQPAKVEIMAETMELARQQEKTLPAEEQSAPEKGGQQETSGRHGMQRAAADPAALSQRAASAQPDGAAKGGWCIAIDLGTTTIAMQARRLSDGQVLGIWKGMNPQRRFGSDVISRMQAVQEGHGDALRACVQAALANGIGRLMQDVQKNGRKEGSAVTADEGTQYPDRLSACGAGAPEGIYLAGNTVMEHLLAGLSVEGLSRHPFLPVTLEEQKVALDAAGQPFLLTLLPGLSAFVGADLLAGVLACGMHRNEKISLLIDLGTNGEIVLGNRDRLLCTATAAGPAFEGGPGNMAPGTDMIAVIAELMDAGIVDETGLMAEPWFESGIEWVPGAGEKKGQAQGLLMTQEQIRAVQMAKAAIYAGICVLIKEYGISMAEIDEVYLAGGFGYYLNVEKAARIGLFPGELTNRVRAAGNTSLAGAYLYGRNGSREDAVQIRKICRAINLAEHPSFEGIYLEHLNLI